jgi:hypothetical protein
LSPVGGSKLDLETEEPWLGHRVRRLRTVLRIVTDPRAEAALKTLIIEAEARLETRARDRARETQQ